jgi:hypothetical protein
MMRITFLLAGLVISFSTMAADLLQPVDQLMTPAYKRWSVESSKFSEQANAVCKQGSGFQSLREQWQRTMLAWSQISALPVGPVVANNIAMQVQFWPDKKNLVAFQVERLLKAEPATIDLTRVSVVLRGLSASEYILFDSEIDLDSQLQREKYCPLLVAATAYQAQLASTALTQWQHYIAENSNAADSHALLTELLRAEASALETLHRKLAMAIGNKYPQPYQAEHWRADYSLPSLAAGLAMHASLWDSLWRPLLVNTGQQSLNNSGAEQSGLSAKELLDRIDKQYVLAGQSSKSIKATLTAALAEPEGLAALNKLEADLKTLQLLYSKELAASLLIHIGFNANDGD